jgi:hypothetical protein
MSYASITARGPSIKHLHAIINYYVFSMLITANVP